MKNKTTKSQFLASLKKAKTSWANAHGNGTWAFRHTAGDWSVTPLGEMFGDKIKVSFNCFGSGLAFTWIVSDTDFVATMEDKETVWDIDLTPLGVVREMTKVTA